VPRGEPLSGIRGHPGRRRVQLAGGAGYGPLSRAARGRIDTAKIAAHWEDMCRVAVSIHPCEVSAHDVTRAASMVTYRFHGARRA